MTLSEHTTTSFAGALDAVEVGLLPVGATEQHGPHLPLGTDWLAARRLAHRVDREATVVLPTIPVGVSEVHRQFHGTLWVSDETLERYVRETVESLASHGLRKVVVVNGHGENGPALRRAARRLRATGTAFAVPWEWWTSVDGLVEELFDGDDLHAGAMETSMVYAVAADLVRSDRLQEAEAGAAETWGRDVHGAAVDFDTADFSESGAAGSPTAASREAGEELFQGALAELDALVDWVEDRPFEDLLPSDHR